MRKSTLQILMTGLTLSLVATGCGTSEPSKSPSAASQVSRPARASGSSQTVSPAIPSLVEVPALETAPPLASQADQFLRSAVDQASSTLDQAGTSAQDAVEQASIAVNQKVDEVDRRVTGSVDDANREFDRGLKRVNASLDRIESQLDRALLNATGRADSSLAAPVDRANRKARKLGEAFESFGQAIQEAAPPAAASPAAAPR